MCNFIFCRENSIAMEMELVLLNRMITGPGST